MRLTLRTMLAYLDDVLDAGDASILGEKIKESEFASNLVSRIRTAISKQKLGAPPVDGKGIGNDPNSVADYLDSALPPDRVPDFERVCLESDGHLAEVAACHQILTLVLGKQATVPQQLRERAYRFGSISGAGSHIHKPVEEPLRLDDAHIDPAAQAGVDIASQVATPTTTNDPVRPAETTREKPEVPEYLREGRRRSRVATLGLAVCVLLILLGVGLVVARQLSGPDDVAVVDPATQNEPAVPPKAADGTSPTAEQVVEPTETETPSEASPATTVVPAEQQPSVPPAPAAGNSGANQPAVIGSGSPTLPEQPAEPGNEPVEPAPESITLPGEQPATGTPADSSSGTNTIDPPATPAPDTSAETPMPIPEPPAVQPMPTEPEPVEELEPVDVGRFLSGDKVLARLNPEGHWMRLTGDSIIRSGDQLVALPAYRPLVQLTSGINLTLAGPTQLEFQRPGEVDDSEQSVSHVDLHYGRLTATTVNKDGSPLKLTLGDLSGTARLADATSKLAVEVMPLLVPGVSPQDQEPVKQIGIYCIKGRIDWIGVDGNAVAITAGEMYSKRTGEIAQIARVNAPPAWHDDNATSPIDRGAANTLEQWLVADRPLKLSLTEVATGPRTELRSMAVRSLAYLNDHDTLINALNDIAQRSAWSAEFSSAQAAIARGGESAALVLRALEKQRSANAKELYRLLLGYSQADLEAGADAKLVEYLDHDAQEFRVLAIENLQRITGKDHLYRAEHNAQRRKSQVQSWQRDLKEGKIRYAAQPAAAS